MNSAPVTLPWISSTTATGESAAAGQTGASRLRQTTIARFILGPHGSALGSPVAPAPGWFFGCKWLAGYASVTIDITLRSAGTTICIGLFGPRADCFLVKLSGL